MGLFGKKKKAAAGPFDLNAALSQQEKALLAEEMQTAANRMPEGATKDVTNEVIGTARNKGVLSGEEMNMVIAALNMTKAFKEEKEGHDALMAKLKTLMG